MDKLIRAFAQLYAPTIRERTARDLIEIGTQFGDDESLMRAKAQCLIDLRRAMVESVPNVHLTAVLSSNLSAAHVNLVTSAIDEVTLMGVQTTLNHVMACIDHCQFDLCTSKLSAPPNA